MTKKELTLKDHIDLLLGRSPSTKGISLEEFLEKLKIIVAEVED